MDDLAATRVPKSIARTAAIPVIAITSFASAHPEADSIAAGAHLARP